MNEFKFSSDLLKAFEALRFGKFESSLEIAQEVSKTDSKDYWSHFLGAVASAYLARREEFFFFLKKANDLSPDLAYTHYLNAYSALLSDDIEKALWYWTLLANEKEGWLAKELIERSRQSDELYTALEQGKVAEFIFLPDLEVEPGVEVENENIEKSNSEIESTQKKNILQLLKKYFDVFRLLVFFGLILAIIGLILFVPRFIKIKPKDTWKRYTIHESVNVIVQKEKPLYQYNNRKDLIKDFNMAKALLAKRKINQARYHLQRIILSNADFKSKEKSKVFLRFIPDVGYQDFADTITPQKIINEADFYANSIVLWEGSATKVENVEKGKIVRMVVRDGDKDYLVEAFMPSLKAKQNWKPYKDYLGEATLNSPKPAVIYGKFKSLIGKNRIMYIELIKLWM